MSASGPDSRTHPGPRVQGMMPPSARREPTCTGMSRPGHRERGRCEHTGDLSVPPASRRSTDASSPSATRPSGCRAAGCRRLGDALEGDPGGGTFQDGQRGCLARRPRGGGRSPLSVSRGLRVRRGASEAGETGGCHRDGPPAPGAGEPRACAPCARRRVAFVEAPPTPATPQQRLRPPRDPAPGRFRAGSPDPRGWSARPRRRCGGWSPRRPYVR